MTTAVTGEAPEIRFDAVSKTFADGTAAVRDFSLTAPAGRITVLVGLSGCGKTTLLRMVNRLVAPTSGRVLIGDRDVAGSDPVALRRSIGYAMQNSGLLPHRRVVDNIATVPVLLGRTRRRARADALGLLERVGLDESLAMRYPGQLSGGQAQRVGVARALAADPDVLLMDEPFGAVDPIVRADLQEDLAGLQADLSKTILFVTHDIGEAFALGDRIVLLETGARIAQTGTPQELIAHPASAYVSDLIGLTGGASALSVDEVDGARIVVDANGRPLGRLGSIDGHPAGRT